LQSGIGRSAANTEDADYGDNAGDGGGGASVAGAGDDGRAGRVVVIYTR